MPTDAGYFYSVARLIKPRPERDLVHGRRGNLSFHCHLKIIAVSRYSKCLQPSSSASLQG
eukprot:scaffold2830_cov131-Cylindrotheca_fusiformis.AAC.23